jgi:predicted permease
VFTAVLERAHALPGVVDVGLVNRLPLGGGNQTGGLESDSRIDVTNVPSIQTRTISPGYFGAMRIPLREGRAFTDADAANAPKVAIVDEQLAQRLWPGSSAIGHRIRETGDTVWSSVVGVVGHVRHTALDDASEPQVYWNYPQRGQDRVILVVRTRGKPSAVARPLATAVQAVDADQPLYDVRAYTDVVDRSLGQRRFQMSLLATFAVMALVLAAIGTYGVIAYGVGQRLREFGIRMALGAKRRDVIGLVVRRGLLLFALGAGVGVLAAVGTVRVLSTLVYGVRPGDPASFVSAVLVLLAVSVAAAMIPARRAARTDPARALRNE